MLFCSGKGIAAVTKTMGTNSAHFKINQINQIRRFAKAPHHQSSGAPNIMNNIKQR